MEHQYLNGCVFYADGKMLGAVAITNRTTAVTEAESAYGKLPPNGYIRFNSTGSYFEEGQRDLIAYS